MSLTVDCTVSFAGDNDGSVRFKHECAPIVLHFTGLRSVVNRDSMNSVNLHANGRIICTLNDLHDCLNPSKFGDTSAIKTELQNADLKMTAPTDIFMKIITEAGMMDNHNHNHNHNHMRLMHEYPDDWIYGCC